MPSRKIIVMAPCCSPICHRECDVEVGQIFIVRSKEWKRIVSFFDENSFSTHDKEYWKFLYCNNYNASEFIKDCTIIEKNPSEEVLKFSKKISTSKFIEELNKLIDQHCEDYSD